MNGRVKGHPGMMYSKEQGGERLKGRGKRGKEMKREKEGKGGKLGSREQGKGDREGDGRE